MEPQRFDQIPVSGFDQVSEQLKEMIWQTTREEDRPSDFLLWHYTSVAGLKGILGSNSLFLTHASYLNDVSEITAATEILRDALIQAKQHASNSQQSGFVDEVLQKMGIDKNGSRVTYKRLNP